MPPQGMSMLEEEYPMDQEPPVSIQHINISISINVVEVIETVVCRFVIYLGHIVHLLSYTEITSLIL